MEGVILWPLGLYFVIVLGVVGGMVVTAHFTGERHREPATGEPYESGIAPTGSARIKFSAHFYLVAMFFVIFDLEAIYLFAWAVAVEDLGWLGYAEVLIFVGILLAAWAYLWRIGALDWGTLKRLKAKRRLTA